MILSKLAALYTSLNQPEQAVSYHRKILALGENGKTGTSVAEMAASYLAVAEWEMRMPSNGERGDWALAAHYLEKVSSTNAPQRDRAEEALRELRIREARLAAGLS
jgi:anaphase-promoting complex subunit 8